MAFLVLEPFWICNKKRLDFKSEIIKKRSYLKSEIIKKRSYLGFAIIKKDENIKSINYNV